MFSIQALAKFWKNIPSRNILKNLPNRTLSTKCNVQNLNLHATLNLKTYSWIQCKCHLKVIEARYFKTTSIYFTDVKTVEVPPFAESVTEGDLRWVKAVGDHVSEDEAVGEVETDKTTVPVNSPCAGVITELLVEDGATVSPGTKIFKIQPGDSTSDSKSVTEKSSVFATPLDLSSSKSATAVATAAASTITTTSPIQASTPIPTVPPAIPNIPKSPLQSIPVAAIKHSSFIQQAEVKVPPADFSNEISGTRTEQRVKMSRMRLRIAQRLKDAQNINAMLTTFNEVDMSNIMELRKAVGEAFLKKNGIKLGFMSAFVNASAYALKEFPIVNAVIENQEIVYRDYVDISVAVATPKGLVVPVIRNVETMNYADIELTIMKLGEKAKTGVLAVEDMDGGTFTISNGGVFGSMMGTPIINPPQSAILGMHGIFERPIAVKGQVVIRPMMYIALTYDHRLIDGREAVIFLRKIKQCVEDPRTMLCGI